MQHKVLWCHGPLQDEKSVPKAASLNPWPDGTEICKTLVLSEDFLNELNITSQRMHVTKLHLQPQTEKEPQTLIMELLRRNTSA